MRPLVEKFGANIALEILLVGDVFPVANALRMGLVNQGVPDDQVASASRVIAEKNRRRRPVGCAMAQEIHLPAP